MTTADPVHYEVFGLPGIPEVTDGTDLVQLIWDAAEASVPLTDSDIVVVTSKIVSKAKGRVLTGVDRDEAIDSELVRTVSEWTTPRGRTRIVETRHGFVMAAAGVDASNVEPGKVVLLPVDPDASARRLRDGLRERYGRHVGVIVTDTVGRVWRDAVVDFAIGAAGVVAADDFRGRTDPYGNDLGITVVAVADELAAASELVRTKLSAMPVAIVRGLPHVVLPVGSDDRGASVLIRPSTEDRFRLGTPEAMRDAVYARHDTDRFTTDPVDPAAVHRALKAALTAPTPRDDLPWRFVVVESTANRDALAAKLGDDGLATAPMFVIPCVLDAGRDALLSVGAAVENLLVALGADGLASRWVFPGPQADAAAATVELPDGWTAAGIVAVGKAAGGAVGGAVGTEVAGGEVPHPDRDVADYTVDR